MSAVAAHLPHAKTRHIHWPLVWTLAVGGVLIWGSHAHLERYITPQRGIGYWLGIVGASMMLLLLIYSARKRAAWLRWLGGVPVWFEIHMTLGLVGPILVLFHANFRLGATNSNVALICMLVVAGSGVVGRYIYTRLHAHMDGNEDTFEELKKVGDRIRSQTTSITFLPGLLDSIEAIERRLIEPPKGTIRRLLHLFSGAPRLAIARWQLRRAIDQAVALAARDDSAVIARHAPRIAQVARRYAARRLEAGRRLAEYRTYAKLFSFWHVLHIPLFFMLLIAGVVHVIAINVY
ncbi:MAG TPA: hypothetical protein VHY75_17140 [Steroidobacteraceae bacterium]|jgi:hypothetical protein|nr:hypothetical protein [Steroidobacteraceae bacterium]